MIEFKLPTMTCDHCVRSVTQAVKQVDPTAGLKFDLPTHSVQIETGRSRNQLTAALTEAGYAPA